MAEILDFYLFRTLNKAQDNESLAEGIQQRAAR